MTVDIVCATGGVSFDLKWVFWVRSKVRLQLGGDDSGRDISTIAGRKRLESITTVYSNDWGYCLHYWRVSFDLKWVFWVRSKVLLQLGSWSFLRFVWVTFELPISVWREYFGGWVWDWPMKESCFYDMVTRVVTLSRVVFASSGSSQRYWLQWDRLIWTVEG
jgi:hypothetical protein